MGHGFASAGIGALAGGTLRLQSGAGLANVVRGVARIAISGTVSRATGGKFGNAAAFAAFNVALEAGALGQHQIKLPRADLSKDVQAQSSALSKTLSIDYEPSVTPVEGKPFLSPKFGAPPAPSKEAPIFDMSKGEVDLSIDTSGYEKARLAVYVERASIAQRIQAELQYQSWVEFADTANKVAAYSVVGMWGA